MSNTWQERAVAVFEKKWRNPKAKEIVVEFDEEEIELAFWEFDTQRKRGVPERDTFKGLMRKLIRKHVVKDNGD